MVVRRIFILGLLVCCLFFAGYGLPSSDSEIKDKIKDTLAFNVSLDNLAFDPRNYVEIMSSGAHFSAKEMQAVLAESRLQESAWIQYYGDSGKPPFAASALGVDDAHHFLNAYLMGWVPFQTDRHWVPQYVIAMRMKYKRDDQLFSGKMEVWQTSHGAFMRGAGDCEDQAVLLADWLIDMGLDARVVLGDYKNKGHAWVVVLDDDTFYLLEPTSRYKSKRWRHYPLARLIKDYHPRTMFNLDTYWVNTGSRFTTNYHSDAWKVTSRFHAYSR